MLALDCSEHRHRVVSLDRPSNLAPIYWGSGSLTREAPSFRRLSGFDTLEVSCQSHGSSR